MYLIGGGGGAAKYKIQGQTPFFINKYIKYCYSPVNLSNLHEPDDFDCKHLSGFTVTDNFQYFTG